MNNDIQFLKELQKELKTQDRDSQAEPRFWTVGDYRWVGTWDDSAAERYSVYIPNDGEDWELEEYLKDKEEQLEEEFNEEAQEGFANIGCELSALDWIKEYVDDGAYLVPEVKEHYVIPNTMFLTKEEAKQHIRLNHYHYTKEVHTYAMTAWRAPKMERLMKILETFDWDEVHSEKELPLL
ncbi:hypothetical protein [Sediminibacillus massiliensis]|uniref:hypothetical protein n=1 Tax=Sediminibacillus massiliensis TaxID=1926277 RepID=UPI0009887082|nr:hypothetical protein [Sediminibacillus massiliensis]